MRFKDGSVNPQGVKTELWGGLAIVQSILIHYGYDCVITSMNDGRHRPDSRHYLGYACDFRTTHIKPSEIGLIFEELKGALPRYDVVLENHLKPNAHGHLEFDPRRWVI